MKSFKTILTGAVALTLASQAFADTEIIITGATAYRIQTNISIAKLYGATNGGPSVAKVLYRATSPNPATLSNSNRSIWQGTIPGQPGFGVVTIKCSWSGSSAGMQTLTQTVNVETFKNSALAAVATPNAGLDGSGNVIGGLANDVSGDRETVLPPDITMQDSAQESTPFTTGAALDSTPIGVVDFVYVANKTAVTDAPFNQVDNMTQQIAQALWGSLGYLPVSYFTGNGSDVGTVFATGRDIGSGTRVITLAENTVGPFSQIQQWRVNGSGGAVVSTELYPATTVLGIPQVEGNSGESSGGNLNAFLSQNTSNSAFPNLDGGPTGPGIFIAGVSYEDVKEQIGLGNLKELKWNGVLYGGNKDLIRQGKYTFWGYERIAWKQALTGDKLTIAGLLRDQLLVDAESLISINSMLVTRQIDGGVVTP